MSHRAFFILEIKSVVMSTSNFLGRMFPWTKEGLLLSKYADKGPIKAKATSSLALLDCALIPVAENRILKREF